MTNQRYPAQNFRLSPFMKVSKWIFKTFFRGRIKIAEDNLRRSSLHKSLSLSPNAVSELIDHSISHLAITLSASLRRAIFNTRSSPLFDEHCALSQRLEQIRQSGIKIDCDLDLETIFNSKRGIIFLSAHLGAWEELMILGSLIDRPLYVISKRMKLSLAQYIWDKSRRFSAPRMDLGEHRARKIVQALRSGECIGAVLDQHDPRKNAIHCDFLGRVAATSPDIVRAALIADAIIIPICLARIADDSNFTHRLHLFSIIDPRQESVNHLSKAETIERLTQRCCDELGKAISMYPTQWLWIHRRWKVD